MMQTTKNSLHSSAAYNKPRDARSKNRNSVIAIRL
jgi:hypothetical protein